MKNLLLLRNVVVLMSLFAGVATLRAQGTAFTYQGRLVENGSQASGIYDLRFTIYDSTNTPGVIVAGPITNTATSVSSGLFTVTLNFGAGVFDGNARWLEIGVKSNGVAGAHIPLTPRQALTPSPYAIFASGAQTASTVATGGVSAASLAVGAVASSAIADGSIQTNDLSAPLLDGTFWRLNGNSGPGNFLGSTDFRPLEFRVNGAPALRLAPTPSTPNILGGSSDNSVSTGIEGATISGGGDSGAPNRIEGGFSAIGGGWGNTNGGFNSFIGGGYYNLIRAGNSGFNSFIGAGAENAIGSNVFFGVVAGGRGNVISNQSQYPTIAGGRLNRAAGSYTSVGGGLRNSAEGGFSSLIPGGAVAGGSDNFASGNTSFIGGGNQNTNTSLSAVIGGGERNTIFDVSEYATISGGRQNVIQTNSDYSVIGGGYQNVIHDVAGASVIAGGRQNTIQTNAPYAVVGGGEGNFISNSAPHAVIAGGIGNQSGAGATFIGGGSYNVNTGPGAFIGGGIANRADNFDAVIGGGAANVNAGYRAFIGGGEGNSIFSPASFAMIGSGAYNSIKTNGWSMIGGGAENVISKDASYSIVGGGFRNVIETNAQASAIAGGGFNLIGPSSFYAAIGGGSGNRNSGQFATIGGGAGNAISNSGVYATIPGGSGNSADGFASFAAGQSAKALHPGAFVWADSTGPSFASTSDNQFSVRAGGGVRLVTGGAGATLDGQPVLSGTVSSAQLADGSVTSAKIVSGAVGPTQLAFQAVGTLHILSGAVGSSHIADNSITANDISSSAIWPGLLSFNVVGPSQISLGAVSTGHVFDNSLTAVDVASNTFWQTSGNANTVPGTHFLGTTDNQPLELRVNNQRALRLEPTPNDATHSNIVNVIGGSPVNFVSPGVVGATIGGGGAVTYFGSPNNTNRVTDNFGTVSGGSGNRSGSFATVGGGFLNTGSGSSAMVGGGSGNISSGNYATVGGGFDNGSGGLAATVPGGDNNNADGPYSFAAGRNAKALHPGAFVWADSTVADFASTAANQFLIRASGGVGIGTPSPGQLLQVGDAGTPDSQGMMRFASRSGAGASTRSWDIGVPEGDEDVTGKFYSFVIDDPLLGTAPELAIRWDTGNMGIGTPAPAAKLHLYSTDNPTTMRIQSAGTPGLGRVEFVSNPQGDANEWRPGYIQSLDAGGFTGGLGFFVNGTGAGSKFGDVEVMRVFNGTVAVAPSATLSFGSQTRQMVNLWGTQYGIGVQSSTTYFRTDNAGGVVSGFAWYKGGVHNDGAQNPGGGATMMRLDGAGLTVNGVFVSTSDRNAKENFAPVDPKEVLAKVTALPISRWNFKQDARTPHVGPMAQDFHAAFGLGTDDKHIATVDADGVALAAIQGLNQKLNEELKRRDAENADLKQELGELKLLVSSLAHKLNVDAK